MTDLILHIGLSKCGSTSIQMMGFRHQSNYLGRGGADREGNELTSDFLRLSPFNKFPSIGRMSSWGEQAYKYVVDRCGPTPPSCVLSSEVLGKPLGSSHEPLLDFLEFLDKKVWRWGHVKVIVVFRSQANRLGSMFAQKSHRYFGANQEMFESFVELCIKKDISFDYYNLVKGLHERIGGQNVLPLFLEEARTSRFWKDLYEFSGCMTNPLDSREFSEELSNKRSIAASVWKIGDPLDPQVSRGVGNTLLTWVWPTRLLPKSRGLARDAIATADASFRRLRFRNDTHRASQIELTPAVAYKIRSRYQEGNRELQSLLSKDLHVLGYF